MPARRPDTFPAAADPPAAELATGRVGGSLPVMAILVTLVFVVVTGAAVWAFAPDVLRTATWVSRTAVVTDVRDTGASVELSYLVGDGTSARKVTEEIPGQSEAGLAAIGVRPGAQIPVRHAPGDPSRAVSDARLRTTTTTLVVIVVVATLAWAGAMLWLVLRRRGGPAGSPDERGGRRPVGGRAPAKLTSGLFVLEADGLRAGAKGPRRSWLEFHPEGLAVCGATSAELWWDDVTAVRYAERTGSRLASTPYELVLAHAGGELRVTLHGPSGQPLPRDADYAAVRGLVDFCRRFATARAALDDPAVLQRLVVDLDRACRTTHRPKPLASAWPGAEPADRDMLAATVERLVAAAGVDRVAGRTIRGFRLDTGLAATLDGARAWFGPHLAELGLGDDVVAAAIDAAQGPVPPWPFDLLLPTDAAHPG